MTEPTNALRNSSVRDVEYSLIESLKSLKKNHYHWSLIATVSFASLSISWLFVSLILLSWRELVVVSGTRGALDQIRGKWEENFGSFVLNYYFKGKYDHLKHFTRDESTSWPWNLPNPPVPETARCSNIPDNMRFDCFPRGVVTEKECQDRGCCYFNTTAPNVPYCFYPTDYISYKYVSISEHSSGVTALLKAQFRSPYPNDVVNLRMEVVYVSNEVIGVNITNADEPRFRFPFPDDPIPTKQPSNPLYRLEIDNATLGFEVIRESDNQSIFNTKNLGGFIFADQFIQVSARLPTKYIYGIGEQRNSFLRSTDWNTITLFNHDVLPSDRINGYGFHPFYLCMEENGNSHGVIVWNHYPMDIVLQPGPAITFRIIGGYLGFFIMLGPSPTQVVEQYTTQVVGTPFLPPYWSLGFHLSRFGYKNLNHLAGIYNQTVAAGIPLDTQWSDIDYMSNRNDFTVDQTNYGGLGAFVDQLHSSGRHYVLILDPGVSGSEPKGTYPPYDDGLAEGVFVQDTSGKKPFIGKVWNRNSTVFPDFSNPKVINYWLKELEYLYQQVKFDGAWIYMNEPSNFLNGGFDGCPLNNLENPPYLPKVDGDLLAYKTLCMSAVHFAGKHYDMHNLYGTLESIVTSFGMAQLRRIRPFVITRSTAPGVGKYVGHWTGDVRSTWEDMEHSIGDILSFSMFGIPMVGADICGFNGNTTASLCQRWSQLGAFYPFSRNHNTDDGIPQDPVSMGKDVADSVKKTLLIRYTLLPYLYTLFWRASEKGTPILQPLFFLDPKDVNTFEIKDQFLWGESLMIAPVLKEGFTYAKTFFGSGLWYDFYSKKLVEGRGFLIVPAPSDVIPLFYRGGSIVPRQYANTTTTESRKNPFFLDVALNELKEAFGMMYWDDGETIGAQYNLIEWQMTNNTLTSKPRVWAYTTSMVLDAISIFSLPQVTKVSLNGKEIPFMYIPETKVLSLSTLNLNLKNEFVVFWA